VCAPAHIVNAIVGAPSHGAPALFDELDAWLCERMYVHYAAFTQTPDHLAAAVASSLRQSENAAARAHGLVIDTDVAWGDPPS
jgi:hypothetical protein